MLASLRHRIEAWILSDFAFAGLTRSQNGELEAQWLKASGPDFQDTLFATTADRARICAGRGALITTGLDVLVRYARPDPALRPSGFVFHADRTGSTQLIDTLRAEPQILVLPAPPLPVHGNIEVPAELAHPRLCELTSAAIFAHARKASRHGRRLAIEFFPGNSLDVPLIREAVPGVPEIFLYRDPVEIVFSLADSPFAPWMQWRTLTGLPARVAAERSPIELAARIVGRIFEAMLRYAGEEALLLNYSSSGPQSAEALRRHLRLDGDARIVDSMASALRLNAKAKDRIFAPDADRKQIEAGALLREMVAKYSTEPYLRLEALRSERESKAQRSRLGGCAVTKGAQSSTAAAPGDDLFTLLRNRGAEPELVCDMALAFLYRCVPLQALLLRARQDRKADCTLQPEDLSCLDEPKIREVLRMTILCDRAGGLEDLLTRLRAVLLRWVIEGRHLDASEIRIMVSIACQCFNNEYAFAVSADEERELARLCQQPPSTEVVAARAMYAPAVAISGVDWRQPELRTLYELQIQPHQEEADTYRTLGSIGTRGDDAVTGAVSKFYDENPYPRWIWVRQFKAQTFGEMMQQQFPRVPPPRVSGRVSVLIAGCGTGRHPIRVAAQCADVEILAIDLSRASLARAACAARRYGITNIEFIHGDLLRVGDLRREFDVVESVGTLHCTADPALGLETLTRALRPGGFMRIGLYSRRWRARLAPFQQAARAVCPNGGARELRLAREMIRRDGAARVAGVLNVKDFYSLSEFRDLLCHPQELQFTPGDIGPMLSANGLDFLGFRPVNGDLRESYSQAIP